MPPVHMVSNSSECQWKLLILLLQNILDPNAVPGNISAMVQFAAGLTQHSQCRICLSSALWEISGLGYEYSAENIVLALTLAVFGFYD